MSHRRMNLVLILFAGLLFRAAEFRAQVRITSPKEQFGHEIGEDYFLANYTQYEAYIKKLAQESNRTTVIPVGKVRKAEQSAEAGGYRNIAATRLQLG